MRWKDVIGEQWEKPSFYWWKYSMKSHLKWSAPSQSQVNSSKNRLLVDFQRISHSFQSSWECRRSNVPNFRGSVNWGVKEEKKWSKKRKEDIDRQRRVRGIECLLTQVTDLQKKRKTKKKRERSERREQEKKEKKPSSLYELRFLIYGIIGWF